VTTIDQAKSAKPRLRAKIGSASWLRGVGITKDGSDYGLQVNVTRVTPEVVAVIPHEFDGVFVVIQAVGDLRPQVEETEADRKSTISSGMILFAGIASVALIAGIATIALRKNNEP
jgi:hypothetical protein